MTWGEDRRYAVQHPSLQDPGGWRWRLLTCSPARLSAARTLTRARRVDKVMGALGAGAEGDGEAGKAASIGSICSRQDLPGWTWLLHPSSAG